jgi:hypothetical protein
MHTHPCVQTYIHTQTHTHMYMHACIHTYIHIHKYMGMLRFFGGGLSYCVCMHACMCTYTHMHTYIHTYMHTYIHAYEHAYIHTHTHTHTQMPTWMCFVFGEDYHIAYVCTYVYVSTYSCIMYMYTCVGLKMNVCACLCI